MHHRTQLLAVLGAALLAATALPATALPAAPPPAEAGAVEAGAVEAGAVGADALLAKVRSCSQISNGRYRSDEGAKADVPVCGKNGAVFFKADMDIDCDGQVTARCNKRTDRWFQDATAFQQSDGKPLNSEKLPFVVVPGASGIWNHRASGIRGGAVAAVVYRGRVRYAVVGDTGPSRIIGEASYAAARSLGIDPDPTSGGTASGVTYILFKNSKVSPIENSSAATARGETLAKQFIRSN
ncbi:glycoside hydrolase family 75 protein [Streptomyces sp. 21So2-11]|uniref:glycoside hydrolase family 75 protein n=1 Tax=Streptomyces sp. 21So2-11 TaxID=3144408 RepID=UPI00321B85C0